ncbi:MAG TPA: EF-P lysine aminoacylase EpmA, partial [Thermoanaerobaculia bacterium]|nr:EF-P lysine aminoacylase EpmA [Thermoanaerobaculia bacterium]
MLRKIPFSWVLCFFIPFLLSLSNLFAAAPEPLPERLRAWLDEVGPLITPRERDAFLALAADTDRDAFIRRFWEVRDPFPQTPRNEARERWESRLPEARRRWGGTRDDRARIFMLNGDTKAVRAWFDEQGFSEVETAILQISPGNETHLHAPRTELTGGDGARATRYFRTSPEFAAKKLLAAGEARIFEFARVFRDRERGDLHLPEFTMLEWYRADASYDAVMADCVVVIAHAAQATGIGRFSFRGREADPFAEPELLTVAAAFERFAEIDLLATIRNGVGDRLALAAAANTRVRVTDDDTWSDIFSKVLVEHVEPNLGQGRLTVLFEYPAPEAALARTKAADPRVAERFEVYACGVELANGFGELTDAAEQRRRFAADMDQKERR